MMPTKQLNSNVVPSIADNDLVTIPSPQGELKNITFANFKASINQTRWSTLSASGGKWIRIAKTNNLDSTFIGILSVTHSWGSGTPIPLVCFVNGSSNRESAINTEQLTKSNWYQSPYLSFPSIRFVRESDALYIEVLLKENITTNGFITALYGSAGIALTAASISTATSDKVLKTIEFAWGGVNHYSSTLYAILQKGGLRDDADEGTYQRTHSGETDGRNGVQGLSQWKLQQCIAAWDLLDNFVICDRLPKWSIQIRSTESLVCRTVHRAGVYHACNWVKYLSEYLQEDILPRSLYLLGTDIGNCIRLAYGKEVVAA